MDLLRDRTRERHLRVESLLFFAALAAGKVPVERYLELLRALSILHEALEERAASSEHPAVRAVFVEDLRRLPLLRRDLEGARLDREGDVTGALLQAEVLAERIRRWSEADPVALLGCLYVLVGSALGGPLVAALVGRGLAPSGPVPLEYLTNGGRAPGPVWEAFSQRMNAALTDEADMKRAASAANETFDDIAALIGHLDAPTREERFSRVRALNSHAGHHPVADDLREIRASLRAGAETWRRYPYFERRYGDRGRGFTRSDSAWLAMLARFPEGYLLDQIGWLGRLLAGRGMPRVLLEDHLSALHRQLCAAVPGRQIVYDKLQSAQARLRRERLSRLPEESFDALAASFEEAVRRAPGLTVENMGRVLVGAVTDEVAGVVAPASAGAVAWASDPERFSAAWVAAVEATVARARREARP